MKKKIVLVLPFVIIPIFIPIYSILDSLILIDIFGCGCVPSTQTNMLMNVFEFEVSGKDIIMKTQSGIVETSSVAKQVEGYVEFHNVQWDFL